MADAAITPAIKLSTPVSDLHGVGTSRVRAIKRLGIERAGDLLRHLPMRYELDHGEGSIAGLPEDGNAAARGTVELVRYVPAQGRGKKGRFEAVLKDDTGTLRLTWFNAGYLRDKIRPGLSIKVRGKVTHFQQYPQMVNPQWELVPPDVPTSASDASSQARVRPVYPSTEGLPTTIIEKLIGQMLPTLLPQIQDPLPPEWVARNQMPMLAEAYRMMHQPAHGDEAGGGRRRLAYNELLMLQLGVQYKRAYVERELTAPPLRYTDAIDRHIRQRFGFELTNAQQRVIADIAGDLQRTRPMNRLLQGDVGAGKTVVALYAMLLAVAERRQAALMAPTELLAEQHFASISRMLAGSNVRVGLVTGKRGEDRQGVADGSIEIVIGTHALLSESVRFHDLAVVVIDEQHRFGVQQRARLRSGNGDNPANVPHTLVMTATPIPRTLSLTLFGDLDVSILDELPPGRVPCVNKVVPPDKEEEVYEYVRQRVEGGEQVFVVVPMIDHEPSEQELRELEAYGSDASLPGVLKSVTQHAEHLQKRYFKGFKVDAVHGRLKSEERQRIMENFRGGKSQVLVATTVIEVGVDIPRAGVMVVEHAERFGLAQLHQLRGRIGRGSPKRKPLCVFIAQPTTDEAKRRMDAIKSTNDGFKIAELDLEIRGMGQLLGSRQSGETGLRVADLIHDMDLLRLAKGDAEQIIRDDPTLEQPQHALLRKVMDKQLGAAMGLVDVG